MNLSSLYLAAMNLPSKAENLLKKAYKRPVKLVLFRVPKDFDLKEMNGGHLNMADLKLNSVCGSLSAIPDLHTNPDRASACPLIPSLQDGSFKCGSAFKANIQILKAADKEQSRKMKQILVAGDVVIKKEIKKKVKKVKVKTD